MSTKEYYPPAGQINVEIQAKGIQFSDTVACFYFGIISDLFKIQKVNNWYSMQVLVMNEKDKADLAEE